MVLNIILCTYSLIHIMHKNLDIFSSLIYKDLILNKQIIIAK